MNSGLDCPAMDSVDSAHLHHPMSKEEVRHEQLLIVLAHHAEHLAQRVCIFPVHPALLGELLLWRHRYSPASSAAISTSACSRALTSSLMMTPSPRGAAGGRRSATNMSGDGAVEPNGLTALTWILFSVFGTSDETGTRSRITSAGSGVPLTCPFAPNASKLPEASTATRTSEQPTSVNGATTNPQTCAVGPAPSLVCGSTASTRSPFGRRAGMMSAA